MSIAAGFSLASSASLSPQEASRVRTLADEAAGADGVRPLSEATLLDLEPATGGAEHYVVHTDSGELAAYGHLSPGGEGELVVAPRHRRHGLGAALIHRLREHSAQALWAHGDLEAARALAQRCGLECTRILRKLSRPLDPQADTGPVTFPEGFRLRTFQPGDEDAWLRVNSRAFVDHPEQGRVTRSDLERLLAQDWFDPRGLLLLTDATGSVVGSHWTKIDPQERAPGADGASVAAGEVYVVALDPSVHGRGLAGPLTAAGLAHLTRAGLAAVVLYVDEGNAPALRTYRRLGFTDLEVHAQYRWRGAGRLPDKIGP